MKKLRILFPLLLMFFNQHSHAAKVDVLFYSTTEVTCKIGDTLVFSTDSMGEHAVWINDFGFMAGNKFNSGGRTEITQYKVQAGDTNFTIAYQPGMPWKGKILINGSSGLLSLPDLVTLYPNPAKDRINIGLNHISRSILIRDICGKICQSVAVQGEKIFSLDISSLPPGLYWVETDQARIRFCKQ